MVADPGQRQVGERFVLLGQLVERDRIAGGLDAATRREQNALRCAGGPGRVQRHGNVVARAVLDLAPPPAFGVLASALERLAEVLDLLERMQVGVIVFLEAARQIVDDLMHVGDAVGDRNQLVDLFLVLNHGHRDFGVAQNIRHFLGDGVLINGDGHRPDALCCHERPVEPRPVRANDRDPVSAGETKAC
jgi:hypothetical protein